MKPHALKYFLVFFLVPLFGCNSKPEKETNKIVVDSAIYDKPHQIFDTTMKALARSRKEDSLSEIGDKEYEKALNINNYIIPSAPGNEFVLIDSDAAIFVIPDSAEFEKLKKEDSVNIYSAASDFGYSQFEAFKFFKKKNIKVIYPKRRYLKFICRNKSILFDTKAKASLGWLSILFTPDSMPKLVPSYRVGPDTDNEYHHFFGRK